MGLVGGFTRTKGGPSNSKVVTSLHIGNAQVTLWYLGKKLSGRSHFYQRVFAQIPECYSMVMSLAARARSDVATSLTMSPGPPLQLLVNSCHPPQVARRYLKTLAVDSHSIPIVRVPIGPMTMQFQL